MAEIEITGIRKDNGNHENPHEAATHYRWAQHSSGKGGINSRQEVVKWVEDGINAYVERVHPRAYCFVNTSRNGTKFLQTHPDATEENNLLKLPEA
jgi:hypothetical protein